MLKVRLNLISKKLKLSVKPRLADQTGLQSEHTPVLTQTDSPTVRSNPPEVKSPQLSLRVQFSSVQLIFSPRLRLTTTWCSPALEPGKPMLDPGS